MVVESIIFQKQKEMVLKEMADRIKYSVKIIDQEIDFTKACITTHTHDSSRLDMDRLNRLSDYYNTLKDCCQEIEDCNTIESLNKVRVPELAPSEY